MNDLKICQREYALYKGDELIGFGDFATLINKYGMKI